jgi:hypothetical protein
MIIWHRRYPDAKGGTKRYILVIVSDERNSTGFPSAFKETSAAVKGHRFAPYTIRTEAKVQAVQEQKGMRKDCLTWFAA